MISKKPSKPEGVVIALHDGDHDKWSVSLDGLVRHVGTRAECEARAKILVEPGTREKQDAMLHRAVGH